MKKETPKAIKRRNTLNRRKRKAEFKKTYLPKIKELTEVNERKNGSFTFKTKYGIVDFFPKGDALLIRKENKWKKPGLSFIINNILN